MDARRNDGPVVALATVAQGWAQDDDAPELLGALESAGAVVEPAMWDDPTVDWGSFDLVVIRSTWDYAERPEEFRAWTERVGTLTRLANPAPVVAWNMDKHYLGELAGLGVPVVATTFIEPGAERSIFDATLPLHGDVVIKPTVSAGSRDTARYSRSDRSRAVDHAWELLDAGRPVMVQPYLDSVDEVGETGMVFFDGTFSHAFGKGPLLAPGAAPVEGLLFAREVITPRHPRPDELALAAEVLAAVHRRLDVDSLLYARVDVLRDDADRPVLLELELVEPSFFLGTDAGAAGRAAEAITTWARSTRH